MLFLYLAFINSIIMIPPIPTSKRILSYFKSVYITELPSENETHTLQLYLRNNQFQLVHDNALYSFGNKYKPFSIAFNHLTKQLETAHRVLVLGAGMGSIPQMLEERYMQNNEYTIVELDNTILQLCKHHLSTYKIDYVDYIHQDAFEYLKEEPRAPFSLICIDIFLELEVPEACISDNFVKQIHSFLSQGGYAIMNYIQHVEGEWEELLFLFQKQFKNVEVIPYNTNKIIIAKK